MLGVQAEGERSVMARVHTKRHPAHSLILFVVSIAMGLLVAGAAGLYAGALFDVLAWGFQTGRGLVP